MCRTAAETVEIHCHGGDAAVDRILGDLEIVGCRIVTWQQLLQERATSFEAECLHALSRASTLKTANILLEQQTGALKDALEKIRSLSAQLPGSADRVGDKQRLLAQLSRLLRWADLGLHLISPWEVVVCGRPNVGKSSLINAIVGYARSIVFDEPGTTRDVVTTETVLDGWPIHLSDTAGLRENADRLESAGIELARERLQFAECRLILVDIFDFAPAARLRAD